jgi:predicted transposase YbfD/YdcC
LEAGNVGTREIAVTREAVEHLQWLGAAQIARIERRRLTKGKESVEIAYLITSLASQDASPEHLLALVCEHWAIENKLRHVRDADLNEDRCKVRADARPLASLRNIALTLIHRPRMHEPKAHESFREDRAALRVPDVERIMRAAIAGMLALELAISLLLRLDIH